MRMLSLLGLVAACGGGGGFPDARVIDAPVPSATFSIAWTLDDSASQPLACDKVGATTVTVLAHNQAFDGGQPEVFTCSTGMGTSEKLFPGTWDFDFQLTTASGVLATAPAQHGVVLTEGQNTQLTPLTFMVDATGGLALTLATNRTDGNCAAQPGGGGIQNTTITLEHTSDQSCAPVTFMIAGGGTYTVDCTTPVQAGCLDTTQTLTVMGMASDNYTIHIGGTIAGNATCWSNNDSLQVPPAGQTLTKTLNLAYATGAPGCP
jgi:hypothetical protein